jgi:lipopolysaccharide export system permease protein
VRFGILQRYVMGEVFRSFSMALLTITIVFVLFIVMAQATSLGLTPREIARLVPFVIPASLPYTVPVSLLFAVTVVYGRLAGDNEVIAVKTAGLSAWTVLWPSISLGLVVSSILLVISGTVIPLANVEAKKVLFKSFEDVFYRYLKKDRQLNRGDIPFLIKVSDVVDGELISPTFKHRADKPAPNHVRKPGEPNDPAQFDTIIKAKKARIKFDLEHDVAHVYLDGADIQQGDEKNWSGINDSQFDIPLSPELKKTQPKRIQEMTETELSQGQRENKKLMALERKRQAYAASLWIGSGRLGRVDWRSFQAAFGDYREWEQKSNEYETERQMRTAMAWGSFFFVVLGAPVGVRFARRDFLSAFITCFVPIILVYYPLMLGGVNLGKDGFVNPMIALWIGNVVLLVLTGFFLRPVLKH